MKGLSAVWVTEGDRRFYEQYSGYCAYPDKLGSGDKTFCWMRVSRPIAEPQLRARAIQSLSQIISRAVSSELGAVVWLEIRGEYPRDDLPLLWLDADFLAHLAAVLSSPVRATILGDNQQIGDV